MTMLEKAKARLTDKGNVKLTLSKRQAMLLLTLLGSTYGSLSYSVYEPLHSVMGDYSDLPDLLDGSTRFREVNADALIPAESDA